MKIKKAKKIAADNKNRNKLELSREKLIAKTINEDIKSNSENEKMLIELKKSCEQIFVVFLLYEFKNHIQIPYEF